MSLATLGTVDDKPARVRDQAVAWQVRLHSGQASAADWDACRRWRGADPAHERAWERLGNIAGMFERLPPQLTRATLSRADAHMAGGRRRALLKCLVLTAGSGAVLATGWSGHRWPAWQNLIADYRTQTGEQRRVVLADSTQLTLNTNSAVGVHITESARDLRLLRGEILVRTASGPSSQRPMKIRVSHGDVWTSNARVSLHLGESGTRVSVHDGSVDIECTGGARAHLAAGQQTCFNRDTIQVAQPLTDNDDAWADGVVVARRMPLSEFVPLLARYRPGVLSIEPALASLQISGVFPVADTDHVLESLARVLPVKVVMRTRYWVTLIPA